MGEVILRHKELGSLKQAADLLMKEVQKEIDRNGCSELTLNLEGIARGIYEVIELNRIREQLLGVLLV